MLQYSFIHSWRILTDRHNIREKQRPNVIGIIENHINCFYSCVKEFVICFNTPLFIFFFNYEHRISRIGVANAECYIESDINTFYLSEKDFVM